MMSACLDATGGLWTFGKGVHLDAVPTTHSGPQTAKKKPTLVASLRASTPCARVALGKSFVIAVSGVPAPAGAAAGPAAVKAAEDQEAASASLPGAGASLIHLFLVRCVL